jgi:hypothetical protein
MTTTTALTSHPGALLARQLHNRLPDWNTAPSGLNAVDLVDPAGVWVLHVYDNGEVALHQRGELAGVLRRPDPGALAAFLTVVLARAQAERPSGWDYAREEPEDTEPLPSNVDGYALGRLAGLIPRQRNGSAVAR